MVKLLLSSLIVFLVLLGWIAVQQVYRRFATDHPQLGPYRQEGGCGGGCSCSQGSCSTPETPANTTVVTVDLIGSVAQSKGTQES